MISSEALDEVSHLRVSAENPVTSTHEHLHFERCAALHNAILKHGWIAGGRDWADAPSRPEWTDETVLEGATENLHPDLIEFLKHCLALEEHGSFFHSHRGFESLLGLVGASRYGWLLHCAVQSERPF